MNVQARTLNSFELVRQLAKHQRGAVYKAIDPINHRHVALRTFSLNAPEDQRTVALQRLLRTAELSLHLDSPNIVRTFEIGDDHGLPFLVMEYVEGNTLASLLARNFSFSAWDLIDMNRQVCLAIDHADSRGISHSNLNPANIMQEWDGTLKIMDYGVAASALRVGPQRYLSPEQIRGAVIDRRSNLFSWAAILYAMHAGEEFPGLDALAAQAGHAPDAKHSRERNLAAAPALRSAILKGLAESPANRYQSGSEFAAALENCQVSPASPVAEKPVLSPATTSAAAPLPYAQVPLVAQSRNVAPEKLPRAVTSSALKLPAEKTTPAKITPHSCPQTRTATRSDFAPAGNRDSTHTAPATASRTAPAIPQSSAVETRAEFLVVNSHTSMAAPPIPPHTSLPQNFCSRYRKCLYATAAVVIVSVALLFGYMLLSGSSSQEPGTAATEAAPAATAPANTDKETKPSPEEPIHSKASPRSEKKSSPKLTVLKPVAPSTADLFIDSVPPGAAIQLDGAATGLNTPHTLTGLSLGDHTIVLRRDGFSPETRHVNLRSPEKASLSISLAELNATITISSKPEGASVFINGRDTGKVTPVQFLAPKGGHKFVVKKLGYFEASSNLELTPGKSYEFSPTLVPMGDAEAIKPSGKLKRVFGGMPANVGRVLIQTEPRGAAITANGRTLNKVTPTELLFPPGEYELTLNLSGYSPIQRRITVAEGAKLEISERFQ
jgi:serine/threonine protein kinase